MDNKYILRDFIKYTILNIFGQMIYSLYTMADTFFVSCKLGTTGLTALNLAFPVFCIINGTGLMLGMGAATKYSIYKSRGKDIKANHIFTNAFYLTIFFAIIFLTAGLLFSSRLTTLLGADNSVFEPTHTYLFVMLMFSPAFLLNNLLQCFVRNDNAPTLSAAAMATGSIANIVLDFIFIFPLNMGIFGAIFATGLAPVISMFIISVHFIKKRNGFHLIVINPEKKYIKTILSAGFSPFLTEAASGIVMFLFNFIILGIAGNLGVAAFGIVSVISLVVTAIYTGLSQGIQPLISKNHGLGNTDEIKVIQRYSIIALFILSSAIYSFIYFKSPFIASVFNSESDQMLNELAVNGLKLYFLACPFIGFNIILSTYFISTERVLPAQVISLLRSSIILIPAAFIMSYIFKLNGVWYSYPATEFIVASAGLIYFKFGNIFKIKKILKRNKCIY